MLITAKNFPDDCKFLNLRLRMEQQRLFAWSETSGLLDLDKNQQDKVLSTNTFMLHRTTVLDLLVQVQCLFKEFEEHQRRNGRLKPASDQDTALEHPEKDAAAANFPLPAERRDFIKRAMSKLKSQSRETFLRLSWVTFDKSAFEVLLSRFATLNDNMTDILDARLQVEIRDTVQDTNRGVLQLHHRIADLGRLVLALDLKLENSAPVNISSMSKAQREKNADGLELLAKLAKFKAFNESMDLEKQQRPLDEATAMSLELGKPAQRDKLVLDRGMITLLDEEPEESDQPRCEATLRTADGSNKRVWIEWKEYDRQKAGDESPPRRVIIDRVGKLAALLNHSPKPEAFRTLHCLGFFDMLGPENDAPEDDSLNRKLGLVFERPSSDELHPCLPPISLRELLLLERKPRVTERIKLAHAISSCLLYLHAVNWLHKGLRSHNVVFFRAKGGRVNYAEPYLTGFDYSRPARSDEATDIPQDDAEFNLYRHPQVQVMNPAARERFKKSFDIYSLGVLFFEIAHWAPVDGVLGYDISRKPSLALRVRDALLVDDRVAELGASMGELFEEAARKCIAGGEALGLADGDVETQDDVAARLSVRFYEDVVKKLDGVRV
ncbi:prion-inhibition and propagation-domain-containing protein [Colletotrichum cereale]|nr:prion-inhibition and propagation-domain-containing protein [Colletotrichum cereale]